MGATYSWLMWLFFAVSVPLTMFVIATWFLYSNPKERRELKKRIKKCADTSIPSRFAFWNKPTQSEDADDVSFLRRLTKKTATFTSSFKSAGTELSGLTLRGKAKDTAKENEVV